MEELIKKLNNRKERLNYRNQDIADKTGLHVNTVQRVLKKDSKGIPTIYNLFIISKSLGFDLKLTLKETEL